ncbi:MAG: ribosomal-processing cysteine protease Prp [Clostridia bacterium]|nr:ribosomal-processing cysteine protease Prp [Clostridia bacterium]
MVTVTLLLEAGRPVGFTMVGHAECGDPGEDIVCSAISALAQTAVIGITEVAKISAGVSVESGDLSCILDRDATEKQLEDGALIIRVMIAGLSAIDQAYPNTLKITDREV